MIAQGWRFASKLLSLHLAPFTLSSRFSTQSSLCTPTQNPYCGYGWGDYPDAELWAKARNATHGSLDVDGVVEGIISEYKRIGSRAYGPGADGSLALADAHRVSLGLEPFPQEHSKKKSHAKKRLRELKLTLLIVGCVVGSLLLLALALYCGRE